ncbi:MAG: glutamate racemase [Bacteroidetes bacterium]|nr:glutamate racemase [Bacteroidota bacterium]
MDKKNMRIAFFDSGIGGMNVLKDAMKVLPLEDFIYFADTDNVPYGTKSGGQVKAFIAEAVKFLAGMNIKSLVVACNTATSLAIEELRMIYDFPIIGMEPAVKPAIENSGDKRVLVAATSLTLKEEKLENLLKQIDTNRIADKIALDGLVKFAEDFNFSGNEPREYLKEKFLGINFDEYEAVVLGCTHFNYYEEMIKSVIGNDNIRIVDGNEGTVRRLKSLLSEIGLEGTGGSGKVTYVNSCRILNDVSLIKTLNGILGK